MVNSRDPFFPACAMYVCTGHTTFLISFINISLKFPTIFMVRITSNLHLLLHCGMSIVSIATYTYVAFNTKVAMLSSKSYNNETCTKFYNLSQQFCQNWLKHNYTILIRLQWFALIYMNRQLTVYLSYVFISLSFIDIFHVSSSFHSIWLPLCFY